MVHRSIHNVYCKALKKRVSRIFGMKPMHRAYSDVKEKICSVVCMLRWEWLYVLFPFNNKSGIWWYQGRQMTDPQSCL